MLKELFFKSANSSLKKCSIDCKLKDNLYRGDWPCNYDRKISFVWNSGNPKLRFDQPQRNKSMTWLCKKRISFNKLLLPLRQLIFLLLGLNPHKYAT